MNKHNNGCWYEILALSTLQVVFPLEFYNLRFSDRPDLIDDEAKCGIEVVHPANEKHEMLNAYYYNHLCGKTVEQISEDGLERFRSNSYDIVVDSHDKTISAYKKPYTSFDMQLIFCAIDKKVKKLNKKLYVYSNNASLFLEMSMYSIEMDACSIAKEVLTYVKTIERDYLIFYKEIFIDCIIKLYRINVETEEITEIETFELMDLIEQKYKENSLLERGSYNDQL